MDQKNFTTDEVEKVNKIRKKQTLLESEIKTLKNEFREISLSLKTRGRIIDGPGDDERVRNLRIGKRKFNENPEEGIKYLVSINVLEQTPESVGDFLTDRSLNKMSVGEYLGNISQSFNCSVLHHYINRFDFTGMEFLDSVRFFLSGFHLPGESQKIDKIISMWASYYYGQNQGVFKSETDAYIMTYAIIMLNTCLHNPTAKKENGGFGREEEFIKIMKNFDKNTKFELDFVKKIFKSIKENPLSCLHKHSVEHKYNQNSINWEKAGWLFKIGGRIRNMKKRWFVLSECTLYYFMHPDSQSIKGMIPLEDLQIRRTSDKLGKYGFEIYSDDCEFVKGCKSARDGRLVIGRHPTYQIFSTSKVDMELWMDAIQRIINEVMQMKLLKDVE